MAFSLDEVAGMVARLDDEGGAGQVAVMGRSFRDAGELLERLAGGLHSRVARYRKRNSKQQLILGSGLRVFATTHHASRGWLADLVILTDGATSTEAQAAHWMVLTRGKRIIRCHGYG